MDLSEGVSRTEKVIRRPADVAEPDLLKLGNHLVIKFHVLMKISQIYDSRNVALHQFVQESLQTINGLIRRKRELLPENCQG